MNPADYSLPSFRVLSSSSGQVFELSLEELKMRVADGQISPLDRVQRADGSFVRWHDHPQFQHLFDVGAKSGVRGPSARSDDALPGPEAPVVRSVTAPVGLLPVTASSPFAPARLSEGVVALRDRLLEVSVEEVLGVSDTASQRTLQQAYEARVRLLDMVFDPATPAQKEPTAKAARFDVTRILATALRTLTVPDDRRRYDLHKGSQTKSPRLTEVTSFAPSAVARPAQARTEMSQSDEEILRYVGFDTEKLKDNHAGPRPKPRASMPIDTPTPDRSRMWIILVLIAVTALGVARMQGCAKELDPAQGVVDLPVGGSGERPTP